MDPSKVAPPEHRVGRPSIDGSIGGDRVTPCLLTNQIGNMYRVGRSTYTVPYHIVGPMAWEYPYHSGQAQEDLPDRLVPASLYGLKVVRPGYLLASEGLPPQYKPSWLVTAVRGMPTTSVTLM